jgi:adenylate cyclase
VLYLYKGWWYVKDLQSKNGVKIKNIPVAQHLLPPGTLLSIGPHEFEVGYQPHELGAAGITPPVDPF